MPCLRMDIENEVARRCGFWRQVVVASVPDTTSFVSTSIQSTIPLGGILDAFVYRRGFRADGNAIAVQADDTVRLASVYDPGAGKITVDRAYSSLLNAPQVNERIDLMAVDPLNELAIAVKQGLRRVYTVQRVTITQTGYASERDLTAQLPYLTDPSQVYRLQWNYVANSFTPPVDVDWWRAYMQDGHVWVSLSDVYPNTLLATVRVPMNYSNTFVGGPGLTEVTASQTDAFDCPLDYAAAFGHAEMWRLFPYRTKPLAEAGMAPALKDVGLEATRCARLYFTSKKPPRFPKSLLGYARTDTVQGNWG